MEPRKDLVCYYCLLIWNKKANILKKVNNRPHGEREGRYITLKKEKWKLGRGFKHMVMGRETSGW